MRLPVFKRAVSVVSIGGVSRYYAILELDVDSTYFGYKSKFLFSCTTFFRIITPTILRFAKYRIIFFRIINDTINFSVLWRYIQHISNIYCITIDISMITTDVYKVSYYILTFCKKRKSIIIISNIRKQLIYTYCNMVFWGNSEISFVIIGNSVIKNSNTIFIKICPRPPSVVNDEYKIVWVPQILASAMKLIRYTVISSNSMSSACILKFQSQKLKFLKPSLS